MDEGCLEAIHNCLVCSNLLCLMEQCVPAVLLGSHWLPIFARSSDVKVAFAAGCSHSCAVR